MTRLSFPLVMGLASTLALTAADMSIDQAKLDSKTAEFDLAEGVHHFQGEVQFRYPAMLDLDCADLKIRLLPGGQKIDRLTASNDVVMTMVRHGSTNLAVPMGSSGGTTKIHAAVAEYTATNDTVTLTGSPTFGQPWVEMPEGTFRGDVITYDRSRQKIRATNYSMIIKPKALPKGVLDAPRPTNAAPDAPLP